MKLRTVASLALLAASFNAATSLACSLIAQPREQQFISADGGTQLRLPTAASDDTAPSLPIISSLKVRLITNGCDGSGASCPEYDSLSFRVEATDDQNSAEQLRYVGSFGASQEEASTAPYTTVFSPDMSDASHVGAYLGISRQRSENWFSRSNLCFALAAVDEAGNVGARSESICVNTIDPSAPTSELVNGHPCPMGCSVSNASAFGLIGLLLFVAMLRRQRMGLHRVTHRS